MDAFDDFVGCCAAILALIVIATFIAVFISAIAPYIH